MSQKTIAQKLLVKEGHKILLVNPPRGYRETLLKGLSKTVVFLKEGKISADIIQAFVTSQKELEEQLVSLKPRLGPKGIF